MTPGLGRILAAAAAVLIIIGALVFGVDSCHRREGSAAETQSHVDQGVANAHLNQAQEVPDHAAELAAAQANVDRARAEVARVKRLLAAKPSLPVLDPTGANPAIAPTVAPDHRDETIAALDVLVRAQDGQIGSLTLALTDKTRQSEEYRLAFEAERRRAVGLEIALEAQKSLTASSKWTGRIQGFAAGAALGLLGGKR